MIEFLEHNNIPYIVVLTKSDKLNKTERTNRMTEIVEELSEYKNAAFIPCSSKNGEGIEELKKVIEEHAAK
ncbi:MAG: hypothetical protein IJM97_08580 [Clostridia bacterium]|nr:hypothetical protein [Clostridia bacterium]